MVIQPKHTVQDFEAYITLPENADLLFELISGEIVEKVPSNHYASVIAQLIAFFIQQFIRQQGIEGYVSGEAGGFIIGGDRDAPDVAFLLKARSPEPVRQGYHPVPPDLAVEVETNTTTTTERRLRAKVLNYLDAGVVVWVVYPETQEVEVYVPGQTMQKLGIDDVIDGGDVLAGFSVAVKEIFTG